MTKVSSYETFVQGLSIIGHAVKCPMYLDLQESLLCQSSGRSIKLDMVKKTTTFFIFFSNLNKGISKKKP